MDSGGWTIERTDNAVVTVRFGEGIAAGWEQWVLVRSDAHHDNARCNRKLEIAHLDKALEKAYEVVKNGR